MKGKEGNCNDSVERNKNGQERVLFADKTQNVSNILTQQVKLTYCTESKGKDKTESKPETKIKHIMT